MTAPKLKMTLKIETEEGAVIVFVDRVDLGHFLWDGKGLVVFEDQHFNLCQLESIELRPKFTVIGRA